MTELSELVERLRERRVSMRIAGLAGDRSVPDQLCTEAAEAIERLEREVEALTGSANGWKTAYEGEKQRGDSWMADAKAAEAQLDAANEKITRQATEIQRMARKIKNQRAMARTTWQIVEDRAHWTRRILNRNKYLDFFTDERARRLAAEAQLEKVRKQRDDAWYANAEVRLERRVFKAKMNIAEAQLEKVREALKPFGKLGDIPERFDDTATVQAGIDYTMGAEEVESLQKLSGGALTSDRATLTVSIDGLTAGDFRRARALSEPDKEGMR